MVDVEGLWSRPFDVDDDTCRNVHTSTKEVLQHFTIGVRCRETRDFGPSIFSGSFRKAGNSSCVKDCSIPSKVGRSYPSSLRMEGVSTGTTCVTGVGSPGGRDRHLRLLRRQGRGEGTLRPGSLCVVNRFGKSEYRHEQDSQ